MRVTIEHQGSTLSAENEEAVDITDAVDLFEEALLKAGFMRPRIEAAFMFKGEEIAKRRKDHGEDGN